jgi:hypothetical protein
LQEVRGVNLLKKIGPWIVSAALCLLAVEVGGAARYYWKTNTVVYFNQSKAVAEAAAAAAPAAPGTYKRRLHPYWGYTGPYTWKGKNGPPTNNLGFVDSQQREVPFKPDPNDFVVFVFGSSVASRLVNNSMYGISLQEALGRAPQLAGKNIVLFNMAQGPGKQPQQLMELSFLIAMGQHIDLVLSLDGTLEFVSGILNFENGIDPIFPPVDILLAMGKELAPPDASSENYYELAYEVTHARAQSQRYGQLLDESTSGIAAVKNRIFKAYYDRSLHDLLAVYDQTAGRAADWSDVRNRMGLDMKIKTSKERIVEDIFDMWVRCSDLMKAMADSRGAMFMNVVLPNPYRSKKVLTESEKAVLFTEQTRYIREPSAAGHAMIEKHAEMLKSRGIVLGTEIFDDIADTIYIDRSGHFNKLGETMVANFLADQVAARMGSPQGK